MSPLIVQFFLKSFPGSWTGPACRHGGERSHPGCYPRWKWRGENGDCYLCVYLRAIRITQKLCDKPEKWQWTHLKVNKYKYFGKLSHLKSLNILRDYNYDLRNTHCVPCEILISLSPRCCWKCSEMFTKMSTKNKTRYCKSNSNLYGVVLSRTDYDWHLMHSGIQLCSGWMLLMQTITLPLHQYTHLFTSTLESSGVKLLGQPLNPREGL